MKNKEVLKPGAKRHIAVNRMDDVDPTWNMAKLNKSNAGKTTRKKLPDIVLTKDKGGKEIIKSNEGQKHISAGPHMDIWPKLQEHEDNKTL